MNKISALLLAAFAAPAFAAGSLAPLGGAEALKAVPVPAAATAAPASEKASGSWTDEVKKAYKQQLDSGRLYSLPELKKAELPAAAQKQLERDNKSAKTAAAYRLSVKNKPAFVVHNRKDGRNLAAHIFEQQGKLVAVAKASSSTPLYWENLSSYTSSYGGGAGYYGPGDVWDGMGGQGPSYGGPDDASGGDFGGWNGNSGGFDGGGYNGI
jgi:hypothetical protein